MLFYKILLRACVIIVPFFCFALSTDLSLCFSILHRFVIYIDFVITYYHMLDVITIYYKLLPYTTCSYHVPHVITMYLVPCSNHIPCNICSYHIPVLTIYLFLPCTCSNHVPCLLSYCYCIHCSSTAPLIS